ncbi:antibiotic biosynthesis monooxygenase [Leisingera aquaemixtae]|uniref:putative quinol monooxygenase n=1 Tax=Leisingera aquaemixtae TaxID=1396826 RepID=UPI001C96F628|nr:antibiotic biosynthesis monooxygenase family protein [Leisingera aquaemixtae]MBY6065847.1 antibiotic biosynthesis monooxygenase [Leisingera aquaemixtae]
MTEAVIIGLHPRPGKFSELTALVQQMVKEVRRHAGCLQADILLAPDRDEISVFQRWQNPEAFSEYLIWRSKQDHLDRVYELSAAEPDLSSFTLCEPG